MIKNIESKNSKGWWHGYQEWYWYTGQIRFRGNAKDNSATGYAETHRWDGLSVFGSYSTYYIL